MTARRGLSTAAPHRHHDLMLHTPAAWSTLIAAYLLTQSAAGAPATTQRARREQLEHLARRIEMPLELVDPAALLAYVGSQSWARETRRSRRTTFRSFWKWALEAGHTTIDAAASLPRIRPSEPLPRPCPDAVLNAALAGADDRARLIMRIAAECGLRRAEIAVLHGTRWYAVDRDVFTVQELLGHASPATTRRYVEVPRDALRRTVIAAAS